VIVLIEKQPITYHFSLLTYSENIFFSGINSETSSDFEIELNPTRYKLPL